MRHFFLIFHSFLFACGFTVDCNCSRWIESVRWGWRGEAVIVRALSRYCSRTSAAQTLQQFVQYNVHICSNAFYRDSDCKCWSLEWKVMTGCWKLREEVGGKWIDSDRGERTKDKRRKNSKAKIGLGQEATTSLCLFLTRHVGSWQGGWRRRRRTTTRAATSGSRLSRSLGLLWKIS